MMEKEYIQVSFENGNIERKSYPAGIRLLDLAKEYQKEDDIVLAKINGRLRELYVIYSTALSLFSVADVFFIRFCPFQSVFIKL